MRASRAPVRIISTKADVGTDAVVRALADLDVPVVRLNSEDYPFEFELTIDLDSVAPNHVRWGLAPPGSEIEQSRSIWYRRVRAPSKPPHMDQGTYEFCVRESRTALMGAVLLGSHRIMSDPTRVSAAENKPYQLHLAKTVGLSIPSTLVTNSPAAVREAYHRFGGRMIVKPAKSGYVELEGEGHAIYTSQVLAQHLEEIDSARWSAAIYQPLLEKACDVRVTVVGDRVLTAEIDSQVDPEARVDWRHTVDPNLPHRKGQLPASVEAAVRDLVRRLGLAFGAIDFIRTPADEYVFLEINPNGQWLWLDDKVQLGITQSIASWLAQE